jgi:hypothetical protein
MVDELARQKTLGAVLDKAVAAAPLRRSLEEARA